MIRFTEHLTEAVKSKSGKNVHLEHLEDEMLNDGYAGFVRGMKSITGLMDALGANEPSAYDVTVKWDGAPAIICGIDPSSGRFFVGTKSVFNVTPKLNFTDADIDANHPAPGLNEKLKLALKYLSKLGIREVLQGDFLFDSGTVQREKIDGKSYLTFQANTIRYAVDTDSKLAKRMSSAKIGIVFHTAYEGNSMQGMSARFNPDISYLKQSKDVWFDNATLRVASGSSLFSPADRKTIENGIQSLTRTAGALKSTLNAIGRSEGVKTAMKGYINALVSKGVSTSHADANQLLAFLQSKSAVVRKKPSNKPTPTMEWIRKNRNQINQVFALHSAVSQLKLSVRDKLASLESEVSTFIKDGKGYRVTTPEGFVAIDRLTNKAVKIVDRLDFSRSNMTVEKTWKK